MLNLIFGAILGNTEKFIPFWALFKVGNRTKFKAFVQACLHSVY